MHRIRIQFSKGEPVRFISHLDMMHVWERALRRTDVPLAFSQGFNPHPKMTFATALAVGVTSEAEFMDIEVIKELDLNELAKELQKNLPRGVNILSTSEVPLNNPALMATLDKSEYLISVPLEYPCSKDELDNYINKVMGSTEIWIEKQGKKGKKMVDIRPGIFSLSLELRAISEGESKLESDSGLDFSEIKKPRFKTLLQAGDAGNVRPEYLIQALVEAELPAKLDRLSICRTQLLFSSTPT